MHTTVIALLYFHKASFSVKKGTNPLCVWWNGSKRKVTFFKLEWIFHAPFHHTFYITHTKDMSSFLQRQCDTPFADKKEELWHLRKFPLWAAPRRWAMKKPFLGTFFWERKRGMGFWWSITKGHKSIVTWSAYLESNDYLGENSSIKFRFFLREMESKHSSFHNRVHWLANEGSLSGQWILATHSNTYIFAIEADNGRTNLQVVCGVVKTAMVWEKREIPLQNYGGV